MAAHQRFWANAGAGEEAVALSVMGSLLVAGAGPKGIAIAAKAAALAAAGLPAPEVTVVDPLGAQAGGRLDDHRAGEHRVGRAAWQAERAERHEGDAPA